MLARDIGLGGVLELKPKRFQDDRGFFSETFNKDKYRTLGVSADWVQDNHSFSDRMHTLRGLHYQTPPFAQDKLVWVVTGAVQDVVVDIRKGSPTFGRWVSAHISAENGHQLFVPKGCAHGFLTLTPNVNVVYKVSAPYSPDHDRSIHYNDPDIGINWALEGQSPQLSDKDAGAAFLKDQDTGFAF